MFLLTGQPPTLKLARSGMTNRRTCYEALSQQVALRKKEGGAHFKQEELLCLLGCWLLAICCWLVVVGGNRQGVGGKLAGCGRWLADPFGGGVECLFLAQRCLGLVRSELSSHLRRKLSEASHLSAHGPPARTFRSLLACPMWRLTCHKSLLLFPTSCLPCPRSRLTWTKSQLTEPTSCLMGPALA